MHNVLLINPKFPVIHQSYDYVLPMLGARFIAPPVGLLTIAALIHRRCRLRVSDLNVAPLAGEDLEWADVVMITGTGAQARGMNGIVNACAKRRSEGLKVVLGGIHASVYYDEFLPRVDAVVAGEGEQAVPALFADMEADKLESVYNGNLDPVDIEASPCPMFSLVNPRDYLIWVLQYSRGCPYDCAFCELPRFFGHKIRAKTPEQFILELDSLHDTGFRGTVMLGDDNFHHAPRVKELLDAVAKWQHQHGRPFTFFTHTDIQLAEHRDLMKKMAAAGFTSVQIGLESPSRESLESMRKNHNMKKDLADSVRIINEHGIEVQSAMLLGMDGDPDNIADLQYDFLQKIATPRCMISILQVYKGSRLYDEFKRRGRIIDDRPSGNPTGEFTLNYRSLIGNDRLLERAETLLKRLYEPRAFFSRLWRCTGRVRQTRDQKRRIAPRSLVWMWRYIAKSRAPRYNAWFVLYFAMTLFRYPRRLSFFVSLGILGYHCYRISLLDTGHPADGGSGDGRQAR